MPTESTHRTEISFKDYRVLYDGQKQGYDACVAALAWVAGELWSLCHNAFEDDEAGHQPYFVRTSDLGKTWSVPVTLCPPVIKNPQREAVFMTLNGPTARGTLIANGYHITLGEKTEGRIFEDVAFRNYPVFIGRREKGRREFEYTWYPSGTFLGEQFIERGIELPSGRLVLGIWGCKARGENWRCGALLSDDDARTWRYRDVGYEPDLGIRDNPKVPAGFNEQSLFRTPRGRLVSIIRAREKLGRVPDSPKDTWFFRSVSEDDGEIWSKPEPTNIAGTGAALVGLTLPDGSLLHACRVTYSRTLYKLPEPDLFGLHLARSFDDGKTWETAKFLQHDPDGHPFTNHYNAMNGQFVQLSEREWLYTFGQFDVANKRHRILAVGIQFSE